MYSLQSKNCKLLNSQILAWVPLVLLGMALGLRIWAVVGRSTEYLIFHHGTEYKNANSAGPKWLEIIPTIWLVFDFLRLQLTFTKLQVDYAQAESWKKEGMNVPTECKNGCVYQMEGDDSGKFHSKHIFDEFEYLKLSIHSVLSFFRNCVLLCHG